MFWDGLVFGIPLGGERRAGGEESEEARRRVLAFATTSVVFERRRKDATVLASVSGTMVRGGGGEAEGGGGGKTAMPEEGEDPVNATAKAEEEASKAGELELAKFADAKTDDDDSKDDCVATFPGRDE